MHHCQNNEISLVLNYFNPRHFKETLCVLSIGENDGITFSNSYDLIKEGWNGVLLEPSPTAFKLLDKLYEDKPHIHRFEFGIADETGRFKFTESGSHKNIGGDVALFSSLLESETKRWGDDVQFHDISAYFMTFCDFLKISPIKIFNFITIDAEGFDWEILQQIDLNEVGCDCLCIEYNGNGWLLEQYATHCAKYGLYQLNKNPENVIFIR